MTRRTVVPGLGEVDVYSYSDSDAQRCKTCGAASLEAMASAGTGVMFCSICGTVHEAASISPGATLRDAAADDATDLAGFGDLGHGR